MTGNAAPAAKRGGTVTPKPADADTADAGTTDADAPEPATASDAPAA